MPPQQLYELRNTKAKGRHMVAAKQIERGDRILVEKPVLTLPPIPTDITHPDHWLAEGKPYNGEGFVKNIFAQQTQETRDTLDSLARNDKSQSIELSIVVTNAFTHHKTGDNRIEHSTIHIYNDISRINHSCRPNAIVEWNEGLKRGTVHALKTIPEKADILVDYMAHTGQCFLTGVERRKELKANYRFDCMCGACRSNNKVNKTDDQDRASASNHYNHIVWEVNTRPEVLDEAEDIRPQQLVSLGQYIDILTRLELWDFKLVEAYETRAKYHEQGAYIASLSIEQPANAQGRPPTVFDHLKLTHNDWTTAFWMCSRIFGAEHPWTCRTSGAITDCQRRLALLPSAPQTPGFAR